LGRVVGCGVGGKFRGLSIRCQQSRKPAAGSYQQNESTLSASIGQRVSKTGEHPRSRETQHSGKRQRSAGKLKRVGADYPLTGGVRLLVCRADRLVPAVCRALRGTSRHVLRARSGGGKINFACCGGCLKRGCRSGGRPRAAGGI